MWAVYDDHTQDTQGLVGRQKHTKKVKSPLQTIQSDTAINVNLCLYVPNRKKGRHISDVKISRLTCLCNDNANVFRTKIHMYTACELVCWTSKTLVIHKHKVLL